MKAVTQVSAYDRGSVRAHVGVERAYSTRGDERRAEGSRVAHKGRRQGGVDIGSHGQGRGRQGPAPGKGIDRSRSSVGTPNPLSSDQDRANDDPFTVDTPP